MSKLSEAEDDPEVYESSGEEWDSDSVKGKKKNNRRTSARQPKKPKRMAESATSEDEEEEEDSEDEPPPKKKSKNGTTNKKAKPKGKPAANSAGSEEDAEDEEDEEDIDEEEDEDEEEDDEEDEGSAEDSNKGKKMVPKTINSGEYEPGSFVILRKDAQVEPSKHPNIWRIDGKALLQKYEAFADDGKVRHRNTSIVSIFFLGFIRMTIHILKTHLIY
ncbi:unnamed protein product [Acanthoscelides obtectus]|uniref:Uncharacterized protein n=1 Tax=Acanthoscelides obtectus TaxID=200917 RepID=A0A9P0JL35_ACAOB|nr:unnamed protein product [Acanthoscelides obtectus]CAK1657978.1 hypothetical protein AOBTE_LOCUS20635 [Acanthoscelides obtectus]